ncbi:recombinase RecT [Priestia megaterium]|uniref:recombinase RecT n=1 Tax=Priestia megaterium TaxID=1404 RepID=UPI0031FBF9C7
MVNVQTQGVRDKLAQKAKMNQQVNQATDIIPQNQDMTAPPQKKTGQTIVELMEKMAPAIEKMLPKHLTVERVTQLAITLYRNDHKLKNCAPVSFLGALMQATQLGLEPNTPLGLSYLIPRDGFVCFQVGYQGVIELAYRSNKYINIYAHARYKNDEFEYEKGTNMYIKHKPADFPDGQPTHYYAVYHLINGGMNFEVWSREQVIHHMKKYAKGTDNPKSAWKTSFDSMAKKTVLLAALKYAPKSIELAQALAADEKVVKNVTAEDDILDIEADYDVVAE